ncbi:hypothetical protein HYH03_004153 [Edaphochlamys debaryana]|uniref:Exonuclease domain-containing protein n=1 Tax=Edaphochlamys debaryana TaxID=47281 RepID=A0A835YAF4_9CHLO|nr:hypothetical protein HYH03_004153 [Edaphochlamys debaryana]|eukprot:KAG2497887.1 hypothetical protein HYH03_004153 [Edaphochlamys debaryana]
MSQSNSFAALDGADEEVSMASVQKSADSGSSQDEAKHGGTGVVRRRLKNPLVWVDLEMTGLDVERDTIIEVACIITDGDLGKEVQGPATAIHHSDAVLESMNDWCKEHHGKSGLTQRVRESTVSMEQAEQDLLDFVQQHCEEGMAQLAGNSIHVDRMFLLKYMPRVTSYLNYRIVDVSSIKELSRRWFPQAYRKAPRKKLAHTALSDIRESIEELRYYRKTVFKSPNQCK